VSERVTARKRGSREGDASAPRVAESSVTESTVADRYDVFSSIVALRQVTEWLPISPGFVLDVSLPLPDAGHDHDYRISDIAMTAGHQVLTVAREVDGLAHARARPHPVVVGDVRRLDWMRDEAVDVLLAEGAALSACLAAEDTLGEMARVLRPGGRLLASADSLVLGLARLAEQHRWPELADAHAADVVVVPNPTEPDGYTRCFGPDELREVVADSGLEVDWVRPRTVLPAAAVRQALAENPHALGDLVISELSLDRAHEGEADGPRLVVSARKPR
jgi:SAM-dependent methyltransferase